MENIFDIMVLGGGPAGYAGAIAAGRRGKKVVLFEGVALGGTCLNIGCIPTKYLLDKAALLEKTRELTQNGVFRDTGLFSFSKIQSGKDVVVQKLVNGVQSLLKSCQVTVVKGFAELTASGVAQCGGETYKAQHTLIATGSANMTPPIPGREMAIDSTAALNLTKVPASMVVIGGGVIGLEMASAYRAFGSEVTVLEMLPAILPNEDTDSIHELARLLKGKGITIETGATVERIEEKGGLKRVYYCGAQNGKTVEADVVLMAAGRKATLKGVDATRLGLILDQKGNIVVDEYMKTNLEGVYAAGDVIGGWQLAHSAYAEAETAVENMLGARERAPLDVMPRCVYTLPPYAAAGLSRQQAEKRGIPCTTGKFSFAANGMALAEGAASGTARVLAEEGTGKIIGAQIVGIGAPEMIATAVTAINAGLSVKEFARMITAHPSLSEIFHEAVLDNAGLSLHTPIKRK